MHIRILHVHSDINKPTSMCYIQNPLSEGTDRINWGKNLTIMIIISIMMNLLDLILLDTILIHKI